MAKGLCLALTVLLALPGLLRAQAASSDPELDNGVRLVDEGDFEEAVERLSGVVQRLARQPGQARELSRAYLYLAIAYLQLSQVPAGALSERSRLIMTYALCGFANLGSLGIMIGGMVAMVPSRRAEIVSLGAKTIISGTLATLMTAAVVGAMTPG